MTENQSSATKSASPQASFAWGAPIPTWIIVAYAVLLAAVAWMCGSWIGTEFAEYHKLLNDF